MTQELYVTITGFASYHGIRVFQIGKLVRLSKEPDNPYDAEAVRAELPQMGKIGYVSNSVRTKANGTMSAGYIYQLFDRFCYARVMFTTQSKVIARLVATDRQMGWPV